MTKTILSSFIFSVINFAAMGQISGMWHNSSFDSPITDYSMSLKGNVKSWTMYKYDGDSRTMTYDKEGKKTSDTFTGTIQTFVPDDFKIIKLKKECEKIYPIDSKEDVAKKFNERMQLLEHKIGDSYMEKNIFDEEGRILLHQKTSTHSETRYWNSIHHESPSYTIEVYNGELVLYRYNEYGSLKEVEYFNSDPFMNIKKVFVYDENNNLIEDRRYDHYNISVGNMPDNYLSEILEHKIDTSFNIADHFEHYWDVGSPAICKYNYNELNQKVEYLVFGYKKGLSFKAEWEYREDGSLKNEIHYDVYRDRISNILDFDQHGNVIREKRIGYDGVEDRISTMEIEYYN